MGKKDDCSCSKGNIVFAECVQENGEKYLWYNITGKQALDVVLETETFSYDMLCNVLNGIYEAVQQLEECCCRHRVFCCRRKVFL